MCIRRVALRSLVCLILCALMSCSSRSAIDCVNDGLAEDDAQTAVNHFSAAIEKDARSDLALALRGAAYHELGRVSAAMDDLDRAVDLAGDSESLARFHRGCVKREIGEHQDAIADFTQAIELEPHFAAPFAQRASAWLALGNEQVAIEDYKQAVFLEPDYDLAHIGLASLYANARNENLRDAKAAVRHANIACQATNFELPQ